MTNLPEAFIFMKVGNHAGETFEQIIERKNREFKEAGRIFWGYGGAACHPITQVQPFVRMHLRKEGSVYLLMQPMDSKADPDVLPATQFSRDGIHWEPIPEGIHVTGSKYALVLDEIRPGDLNLVADEYEVGIGPSRGKLGSEYLQHHIDKACLVKRARPERVIEPDIYHVGFEARLLDPYAVLLRGERP